MGFIPQITCRHCGKQFSAIHNRCPHCGTRRVKQTARTPVTTASVKQGTAASARASSNTRWQFIFGCVIVVAVIVAVIVLITASIDGGKPAEPTPSPTLDVTPSPTPTPTPTPTPSPTPTVTSITITFLGESKEEFAMSVGDVVDLDATVYPMEAEAAVEWRSQDESICTVDKDGMVTGVGSGWGKVIAQCGGVAVECKVWVR